MPPLTDAIEVTEIAKKMLQTAGYSLYRIEEVRPVDRQFWEVKVTTLSNNLRMKINTENGKVEELLRE